MSEALSVFSVTLTEGSSSTVGSLAWAITQANAYVGDDTPTIVFDASLGGQQVSMDEYLYAYRDMNIISQASTPVQWCGGYLLFNVYSGVQVSVGAGIELINQVQVWEGACLRMAAGSTLSSRVSVSSGGELELQGVRVEGGIYLADGALIHGQNNVFCSSTPLRCALTNAGTGFADTLAATFASLLNSTYEAGELYVLLESMFLSESVVLPVLPEIFLGYEFSDPYTHLEAGATLTVARGVDVFLPKVYDSASIAGEGSFVLEGGNTLHFYDDYSYGPFEDGEGTLHFSCARVELNDCTILGEVSVAAETEWVANGVTFGGNLAFTLNNWDAATPPTCLTNMVDCTSAAGAALRFSLSGLGGSALAWNESGMLSLLSHEAFSSTELVAITLQEGDYLTLPASSSWKGRCITIGAGATLECGKNCRLEGDSSLNEWDEEEIVPPLVVEEGGTLVANKLTISGTLVLAPTAKVEGTLHFEKGSRISLTHWSGSTQQLLDSVLAGATWTSDEPLQVEFAGPYYTGDAWYSMVGDTQLVDLGSKFGSYVVPEADGYVDGCTITFAKGVDVELEDCLYGGTLIFEGDNVVRMAEGYDAHLNAYDSVVAHGTRFEVPVMYVENLTGENITFAAQVPFGVQVGGYGSELVWDGTAAALQEVVTTALQGVNGYTITAKNPILGLECYGLESDLLISEESLKGMLPAGFSGLHLSYLEYSDHTITVAAGATMDADNIYLGAGATLILEEGARLVDSVENDPDITVEADDSSCGTLVMTGVDLNGAYIYSHGNLTLSGCSGKGELVLSSSYSVGQVRVNGCDLSQVSITMMSPYSGEAPSDTVFDFSGNYWGTTDMEEIAAMIRGYDAERIIIGEVLSAPPAGAVSAPELTLFTPQLKPGKGKTTVTLSWAGETGATYELYVDDKRVMSGKKTSWKGSLADGEHRYTVVAKGVDGFHTSKDGEFRCDATAPVLTVREPQITKTSEGSGEVLLSWASTESATYVVKVNKVELYRGTTPACTLNLSDGKYSFTLEATDAFGNTAKVQKGSFVVDTVPPPLNMKELQFRKIGNGQMQVTFSWKSESKAAHVVMVDGRIAYQGTKTSCKLTLADGEHSYTVTATDATGNSTTASGSFEVDTTAPVLSLGEHKMSRAAEGKMNITFNWKGEEGATYTLKLDGKTYKNISATSFSLDAIKDGKHKYELTATDAFGNSVTLKDSFTFDATGPKLSVSKPKLAKAGEGKVNALFSWKGEKNARYTLYVDGKSYDVGTSTSYELIISDGVQAYTVVAADAAGNTTSKGGSFTYDATAPVVSQANVGFLSMKGETVQATLSWEGEAGATYTVMVDGKKAYSGKKTSCTLKVAAGSHSYSIVAADKARNTSEALLGSFDTAELVAAVTPAAATAGLALSTLDAELALSAGALALPEAEASSPTTLCSLSLQTGLDELQKQSSFGTLA